MRTRKTPPLLRLFPPCLLLVSAGACLGNSDGAGVTLTFGYLPQGVGTPCQSAPSGTPDYVAEIENLRMRVSGPGMRTSEKTFSMGQVQSGEVEMERIPVGDNRNVLVTGLRSTLSLWRGGVRDVSVQANKTTDVNVFMTRVADMTCARAPLQNGRSFHTATPLPDGRVLLTGGISQQSDSTACSPLGTLCRQLVATGTADVFDPSTGRVFATGSMLRARAFHTATALPDGRVIIVGGAASALVSNMAPFPIIPSQGVREIEVYDPATGEFTLVGQDTETGGRTFAASVLVPSGLNAGAVLITGGGSPALFQTPLPADPSQNVAVALRSTLLCKAVGGVLSCTEGQPMQWRRAGHIMAPLSDGSIVVFGGSIENGTLQGLDDSGAARPISKQAPEFFNGQTFVFPTDRPAFVEGSAPVNNVFFGAAMQVPGYSGVFIVGGLVRRPENGTPALQFEQTPNAQVWFLAEDATQGPFMSVGTASAQWQLAAPRYLPAVAALGDGTNWAIAGGFAGTVSDFQPSDALEFFDGDQAVFKQIMVGGVPRTLRQTRGGVSGAGLTSGTALFGGGMTADTTGRPSLDTLEIFTDTKEPPP